jgi:hypothetical protein
MSATITMTAEQFAAAVRKEMLAQTGSQSVKKLQKDQPSVDISTKEKLIQVFSDAGHEVCTNFLAAYNPPAIGKKDQPIGGYGFVSSPEKVPYNGKAKLWLGVSGLAGLASLDKVQLNVGKLETEIENLKNALEIAQDLHAGFTAVYRKMTEMEPK